MTNNPAIHRRASGDIDIAVPHDGPEHVATPLGSGPLSTTSAAVSGTATIDGGGDVLTVPAAA
ncbi:hypothetical protein CcI49_08730 [Frankia sp. CcI49]|uniref:hypothetical protein n=1 Tax=unclassified Frankia TaxID=2632575 RepID=UPI0006C9FB4E|nr:MULTISPECIES: hypothetical protein [unclassified Frankia]KPM54962.1 hypothetical protein ACG83_16465 [Frankia sp. R43]ONH61167.1 hypothetical protein CcI49_08730 [Frankia sp. CcI49]